MNGDNPKDLQLAGKGALVTGGACGIGRGICEVFAGENCIVALHGHDAAASDAAATSLRRAGRIHAIAGNLGDEAGAPAVYAKVTRAIGAVGILVHCVGVYATGPWQDRPAAAWARAVDANLLTMMRIVQQAVRAMRARRWGGSSSSPARLRNGPMRSSRTTALPMPRRNTPLSAWRKTRLAAASARMRSPPGRSTSQALSMRIGRWRRAEAGASTCPGPSWKPHRRGRLA